MCIRDRITRPALILADEPTGNLDTQNSSEVIALLKEASKKYEDVYKRQDLSILLTFLTSSALRLTKRELPTGYAL